MRIDVPPLWAHDYEPHRWGCNVESPPMDLGREMQAYADIRRESRVVASKRDRASWLDEQRARIRKRDSRAQFTDRQRDKGRLEDARFAAIPEKHCEVCGVKLERQIRGKAQKRETAERFKARHTCSPECRAIRSRKAAK
jgi:hypothetical protein